MISPVLRNLNSTVSFSSLVFVSKKRAFLGERIWGKREFVRCRMTVSSRLWIEDACLKINGYDALTGVPDIMVLTLASYSSVFLGRCRRRRGVAMSSSSGFYSELSPSLSPPTNSLLFLFLSLKSLF
ncbi:hypothetical protein AMTRI_Chr04g244510 [Amborella trichopoda]